MSEYSDTWSHQNSTMDVSEYIEKKLRSVLVEITLDPCPAKLAAAMNYAVFPGGARVRPKLVMAVAGACADASSPLALESAVAVELLHCASLVQDDLACFDDAESRRSKPTLHLAFDERLAILASDALIVAAFERISSLKNADMRAQLALVSLLTHQVGAIDGITAGQAWESEEQINTDAYHRSKTGALFAAATQAGALAVGVGNDLPWAVTGHYVGIAYQIADDIHDVMGDSSKMGKPVNVDARHGHPNSVHEIGLDKTVIKLKLMIEQIVDSVPDCKNADFFIETIRREAQRFVPKEVALSAA
ncbi:MAG: polyprenyl synthetase family protein [Granulosicoccus sp.]